MPNGLLKIGLTLSVFQQNYFDCSESMMPNLKTSPQSFQMLVAISFSLWRSVFLSDKTGFLDDTNRDAVKLLSEMLENNAIGYPQEHRSRNWTFNYYAVNALYRLQELRDDRGWSVIGEVTPNDPKEGNVPKIRWHLLQQGFERAVDEFEKMLELLKNQG